MLMLSNKPTEWLKSDNEHKQNQELLLHFAKVYTATTDKQRLEKLNKYGIIPNRLGGLCKIEDLKINKGIDSELQKLYQDIFKLDLNSEFVDDDFISIYPFPKYTPIELGQKIQNKLQEDGYQDRNILLIIHNFYSKEDWRKYFPNIFAQRETLSYRHGTKEEKESLFRIQMQGSEKMKLIANLTESENFETIINNAENMLQQQQERDRQFHFTHTIGKFIEDCIRENINKELSCQLQSDDKLSTIDNQGGQDIVISYKKKNLYYLECKAKWTFNESAHMSSLQIKQAVKHPENYALCCIDCTKETGCQIAPDATQEAVNLIQNDILAHTYVHTNIGEILSLPVKSTVIQEEDSTLNDEENIKVYGNFSCNIPKKIFIAGTPFCQFISDLQDILKRQIENIS